MIAPITGDAIRSCARKISGSPSPSCRADGSWLLDGWLRVEEAKDAFGIQIRSGVAGLGRERPRIGGSITKIHSEAGSGQELRRLRDHP